MKHVVRLDASEVRSILSKHVMQNNLRLPSGEYEVRMDLCVRQPAGGEAELEYIEYTIERKP